MCINVYLLLSTTKEETRQAKLTAKYLGTLRRPLEAFEKVKIHSEVIRGLYIPPLLDLPAVYQGDTAFFKISNLLSFKEDCCWIVVLKMLAVESSLLSSTSLLLATSELFVIGWLNDALTQAVIVRERQYAGRLLFMMGNQAVEKICQHAREVALDQLFLKGKPRECAEDIEKVCRKAINICTAIYTQVLRLKESIA